MAWTTMHFAVGMGCTGAAFAGGCLIMRRGWRWLPAAMTVGGFWALVPDLPRIFREDLPGSPLTSLLGSRPLERQLNDFGDLFWMHRTLDAQPHEYALHGLLIMIVLYNLAIALLMKLESKQRNSPGNRAWRAHGEHLTRTQGESAARDGEDAPIAAERTPARSSHLSRAG